MSVETTRTLRCDFPACHAMHFALDHVEATVAELRATAVDLGYQVNAPGGLDFCPEHRKRRTAKATKPTGPVDLMAALKASLEKAKTKGTEA